MSVGADVENGLWSIYGARMGCHKVVCTDWDINQVRDFEYLLSEWHPNKMGRGDNLRKSGPKHSKLNEVELMAEIIKLGHEIRNREEIDLPVLPLSTEQSKFFKSVYMNSPRIFKKRKL
jgi:hypothetical protein